MHFLTYRIVYKNHENVVNLYLLFADVLLLLFLWEFLQKWKPHSQMEKLQSWTTNISFQIEELTELLWNQVILCCGVLSIRTGPKNNK